MNRGAHKRSSGENGDETETIGWLAAFSRRAGKAPLTGVFRESRLEWPSTCGLGAGLRPAFSEANELTYERAC